MSLLKIIKTKTTPEIVIDCIKGTVEMDGSCLPEDSISFFRPIYNQIDCLQDVKDEIIFNFNLDYINSGSLKAFVDLFLKIKEFNLNKITINWYIEEDDEELLDTIEDIHRISNIDFNIHHID